MPSRTAARAARAHPGRGLRQIGALPGRWLTDNDPHGVGQRFHVQGAGCRVARDQGRLGPHLGADEASGAHRGAQVERLIVGSDHQGVDGGPVPQEDQPHATRAADPDLDRDLVGCGAVDGAADDLALTRQRRR